MASQMSRKKASASIQVTAGIHQIQFEIDQGRHRKRIALQFGFSVTLHFLMGKDISTLKIKFAASNSL